jgi:hypothetical protein
MSKKPAGQQPAAPVTPAASKPNTTPAKPQRPATVLITDGADIEMVRKGTQN